MDGWWVLFFCFFCVFYLLRFIGRGYVEIVDDGDVFVWFDLFIYYDFCFYFMFVVKEIVY